MPGTRRNNSVLESSRIDAIKKRVKQLAAEGIPIEIDKQHGSPWGAKGRPDLDGSLAGVALKIEVKRDPKQAPTPHQKVQLRRWRAAGAITGVIVTPDEMEAIVRQAWTALAPLWDQQTCSLRPIANRVDAGGYG